MKNPMKGLVVWTVPENKEASITLFGDPRSHDFEDKMWTFFIEDVRITIFFNANHKRNCSKRIMAYNSSRYPVQESAVN
jgi:hypothetical protein